MPELTPQEIAEEEKAARSLNILDKVLVVLHTVKFLHRDILEIEAELAGMATAEGLASQDRLPNRNEASEQLPMPSLGEVKGVLSDLKQRLRFSPTQKVAIRQTYRKLARRNRGGL